MPELSSVTMTPVMKHMNTVAVTARDIKEALAVSEELLLDLAEAAWIERHSAGDIMAAQERAYSRRNQLYKKFKRRGIEGGGWNTTERRRPRIENQPVPSYIVPAEIAEIHEQASQLLARLARIEAKRNKHYPADHKARLDIIKNWGLAQAS